jgi:hypothetical protein
MHFKRTNEANDCFFLIFQPVCNVNISVSISPLAQIIIHITLTYFGDATFYIYQK